MQGERVWSTDVLCFVVPQALYTEVRNADVGSGSAHIYIYIYTLALCVKGFWCVYCVSAIGSIYISVTKSSPPPTLSGQISLLVAEVANV